MPIHIKNWGGKLSWILRVRYSKQITPIAIQMVDRIYKPTIKQYIKKFNQSEQTPLFSQIMIETVNRCNGECAFCPANIRDIFLYVRKKSFQI